MRPILTPLKISSGISPWHRSAVKAEQGCQPTCSCETWTSHQLAAQIPVDLKWWRRVSPSMEDASWP